MKDELAFHNVPSSLEGVIRLATRVDSRIQDRRHERRHETFTHLQSVHPQAFSTTNTEPQPEGAKPMQLGYTSLLPGEGDRRQRANLCLYCSQPGHYISG